MRRPELPVLSILSFILVLIPLPWHWRARNVATLCTIIWVAGDNLIHLVNSIVWNGNVIVKIPVWCDITTKFFIGSWIGIPCCALCLVYHLESVASTRFVTRSSYDRRRRLIGELSLCVGLPILIMILHYLVQGHRFDIYEDFGCQFNLFWSWQAILVLYVPPLIVTLLASIFAILALRAFMQRRAQFREVLASSQSGLNTSRYLRLMGMALSTLSCSLGFSIYVLVGQMSIAPLRDYESWYFVHVDFSRIGQYEYIVMPAWFWDTQLKAFLIVPLSGFIFFFFFGFGEEATREYKRWFKAFRKHVLRQEVPEGTYLGDSTFGGNTSQMSSSHPRHIQFPQTGSTNGTRDSPSTHTESKSKWEDIDLPTIPTTPSLSFNNKKFEEDEEASIGLDAVPSYTPQVPPKSPTSATMREGGRGHHAHPSSDTLVLPPPPTAPTSGRRPTRPGTARISSPTPAEPRNSLNSPPQPSYPMDEAPTSPTSASPAPVTRMNRERENEGSIALSFDESVYPIGEEPYRPSGSGSGEDVVFGRATVSLPASGRTPKGAVVVTIDKHVV